MTKLTTVFRESFEMLLEKPILFVPRLLSAGASSLLIIAWFTGTINSLQFLAAFPVIALIGAFTPVVVSSMVEKKKEDNVLKEALTDSINLWKPVLGLAFFTMFLAFLNSLPLSLGLIATYLTGNIWFLIIGAVVSLVILLGIGFGLYFVPISIVRDRELFIGMQNAFKTSNKNRKEVMALTIFSLAILAASSTVTGRLRDIGILVFFLGRIVSSIVGTYILVISPQFYLSQEEGPK